MLKVNDLYGRKVYVPKKARKKKDAEDAVKLSRLGRVHMAVFSPRGREVVGFLISRPDVVGMVKRDDVFAALDALAIQDDGTLCVTRERGALDDEARKRLGIDWDACVMWAGMDAKTVGGKVLGYVSDAEFDAKTGAVSKFFVGDGGMARAIVGSFEIPASMVRGYSKGYMIVDDEAANLELDGGVAAKAGEGYAKAKVKGAEAAQKAGKAAGEAVDKGSYAFGRMLGKAKRAIQDATADDADAPAKVDVPKVASIPAADVRVSEPVEGLRAGADERASAEQPKTYAPAGAPAGTEATEQTAGQTPDAATPAAKKPSAQKAAAPKPAGQKKTTPSKTAASVKPQAKKKATGEAAAKAMGKQIGRMGKMFSSFKDEFDKASK